MYIVIHPVRLPRLNHILEHCKVEPMKLYHKINKFRNRKNNSGKEKWMEN